MQVCLRALQESAEGGDVHFTWAVAETQGRRPDMVGQHISMRHVRYTPVLCANSLIA